MRRTCVSITAGQRGWRLTTVVLRRERNFERGGSTGIRLRLPLRHWSRSCNWLISLFLSAQLWTTYQSHRAEANWNACPVVCLYFYKIYIIRFTLHWILVYNWYFKFPYNSRSMRQRSRRTNKSLKRRQHQQQIDRNCCLSKRCNYDNIWQHFKRNVSLWIWISIYCFIIVNF